MKRVATLFVSLAFSLACAEIALQLFDRYPPPDDPLRPTRPDLYQVDDLFGYRLWRSTVNCYRYPPDAAEVIPLVSNSSGFRGGRELDEQDPRPRIAVLGDSMVFGSGVREEHRLTEVMENLEPGWRVDNLGMTGWGVDLMLRALEHVGLDLEPDVVVLSVYTDDFRRLLPYYAGTGFPIPKFRLDDGALADEPYPHPARWERLRIVQAVHRARWRRHRNRFDLNGALFDRFAALAREHDFAPVVVFIPGKSDTPEDRQRRGFLSSWAARTRVPFLDLTDSIHGAGRDNVFIKDNWHWNPEGHRIAGTQLREFIARHVPAERLVGEGPAPATRRAPVPRCGTWAAAE